MDTPVILTFNFFAIQDWKEQGNIVRQHVPGVINPADDVTKPLGWMLHSRHARRIVGHYPFNSPLGVSLQLFP